MAITDGQRVRALESNAAWASKTADNTLTGKQTLNHTGSGAQVDDVQQSINDLNAEVASVEADVATLQSEVAALEALDTFIYVGVWDASINSPLIADGDGGQTVGVGAVLRVNVAGSQDLGSGTQSFNVGDKVVYNNAGVWEKWDTSDEVTSVNGQTGDVSLALDDLTDVNTPAAPQRSLIQKGVSDWETLNPNEIATNSTLTGADQVVPATDGFFKVQRLTNAGLSSVEGIGVTYNQQKLILVNATGGTVTVRNDSAATPAQGIVTGTANDMDLQDGGCIILVYDSTSSRWRVIGGSGGGGVGYQETPAGAVNGSNTVFGPLTFTPSNDNSIIVFVDGIALKNTEWTKVGSNVQLSVAPSVGQSVYVFYLTSGAAAPPPVISGTWKTEYRTLTAGEITAKAIVLAQPPAAPGEVMLDWVGGGGPQFYGDDFVVSVATLSWSGLALDGVLTAGDKLRVAYVY